MNIEAMMNASVNDALTEDTAMTSTSSTPVMATPAAFAGAGAYAFATLQAYDLGRQHAGANG